jgi:D-alanine-D-alanine ligase-like ATP-grasp enzyme
MNKKYYQYYSYFCKLKEALRNRSSAHNGYFLKKRAAFFKELWVEAAKELGAEIMDIGYSIQKIQKGSAFTFVRQSDVMLDDHLTLDMAGNKTLVLNLLKEHNFPTVRFYEYDLQHLDEAFAFMQKINCPAVIKPAQSGSAGKGITTSVQTWKDFKKASLHASVYCEQLLLEEQVEGNSYRLLYLDNQFIDAIRRNPPRVIGDEFSTIKSLIDKENIRRTANGAVVALHPLTIDFELEMHLKSQKLTLHDVLDKGRMVSVKRAVNQNSSEDNESVKKHIHPSFIEMGAHAADLLKIKLAGIDIISDDITKPLSQSSTVINEINTTPGLHHHYLISNKSEIAPVAGLLLKHLLNI